MREKSWHGGAAHHTTMASAFGSGDIAERVAGEVPSMLHPREGLLDEGLARPVDLPGDREARAPEVAVDNVGGGPHTVEEG